MANLNLFIEQMALNKDYEMGVIRKRFDKIRADNPYYFDMLDREFERAFQINAGEPVQVSDLRVEAKQ